MRYNAPLSCLLLKQNRKTVSRSPLSLLIHHRFSHGRQSFTQPLMPFVMMGSVMPDHDFTEARDDQRCWQHDQTRSVDRQSFRYHAYQISDAQNFREHLKTANWERYPAGPANRSQSLVGNPIKISAGPRNQRMILRTELIQRQRRTACQRMIFTQQTNIFFIEQLLHMQCRRRGLWRQQRHINVPMFKLSWQGLIWQSNDENIINPKKENAYVILFNLLKNKIYVQNILKKDLLSMVIDDW